MLDKEIKYALKERTITIVSQEVNLLFIVGLFLSILSFASVLYTLRQFGGMERAIEAADDCEVWAWR